jgi:hypothetical protein
MKTKGQGSSNKPTSHEAGIAIVLEAHGFILAHRKLNPTDAGYYYRYQGKGSQQKGDFELFWVKHGNIQSKLMLDAKHSNTKIIILNDGWFDEETIYIISYNAGTPKYPKYACFIGLGRDIPTECDDKIMYLIRELKKELNRTKKTMLTNFLGIYFRFANQYSCTQFTEEFAQDRLRKTLEWLEP